MPETTSCMELTISILSSELFVDLKNHSDQRENSILLNKEVNYNYVHND